MNILFSFRERSNFLVQAFLLLQITKKPNPSYPIAIHHGKKLFYVQSRLSGTVNPIIRCLSPPESPNHNYECNDFTTICDLFSNPSFAPGPDLETALDRTGIELDPPLLQRIFDDCGSSSKQLLSLFIWAEKQPGYILSVGIFNAMIKVLARAREFESAWCLIFRKVKRPIEGPNMDTFSILIRRYAHADMPSSAIRTLEFACSLDLIDNSNWATDLFEILLDSFCKEGLVCAASEYFNRKSETSPSWALSSHVYNILLNGWFRAKQLERVECLWNEMKKQNVKPSVVTYGTLVEGYCRARRVEVAIELFREMRRNGIEPDAIIYNPIIYALGEVGRFQEALAMMELFLVLESGPTISTYNSLVKCLCRVGDIEGANRILKMMITWGVMPTITTYNYFLSHFLHSGKFEEGLNLYTKMTKSGYAPDQFSFHLMMILFCKQERLDLAIQLRKEMKDKGYDLDSDVCTMFVHLLCTMHRVEDAFLELEDMIRRGIIPHYLTYQRMGRELKEKGMIEMSSKLRVMMAIDDDASRARGKFIIRKAKSLSDTLKTCRDPRELVKRRRSLENNLSGRLGSLTSD